MSTPKDYRRIGSSVEISKTNGLFDKCVNFSCGDLPKHVSSFARSTFI